MLFPLTTKSGVSTRQLTALSLSPPLQFYAPILRTLAVAILLLGASFSQVKAQAFSVLHSFTLATDGSNPLYSAVRFDSSGNMFGTNGSNGANGAGTIWEYSSDRTFTILHSFTGLTGGQSPLGTVNFDSNGNMYGTCYSGGISNVGIIWEVNSEGIFSVLHSFVSASEGQSPYAGVTFDSSGNMYGTCSAGGSNGGGTLWKISSGGTFSVLRNLTSASDGANPRAGITFGGNGNMYGTCSLGGAHSAGTIWKISSGGTFTVLHSFTSASDGKTPYSGVTLDSSGNMYGTCTSGGVGTGGTVWKLTTGGTFSVLHAFSTTFTGISPDGGVTFDTSGNMYGACYQGGNTGDGTIWEYSLGGTFSVLVYLDYSSKGSKSYGNVTFDTRGNMYATCNQGGTTGGGTIWEYTPAGVLTGTSVSSNSFMGGTSSVGTVALNLPAGSSGLTVSLSSSSQYAVVPPSIKVPAGAATASFPIWTAPCSIAQSPTIIATDGTNTFTTNLSLSVYSPYVFNVQIAPTYVVGGTTAIGQVQIDHFVTTIGGEVVDLSSSNVVGSAAAYATVPASVIVPFGANSTTFSITTQVVSSVTGVSVTATDTSSQTGLIMLLPSGGLGIDLSVNPGGIYGGNSATGTVTLSATRGSDTIVSLSSNNSGVTVPASVTIPAGSSTGTFTVTTTPVTAIPMPLTGGLTWIACSTGLSSQAFPIAVYPTVVHYVTASPSSVTGGGSSTGTVYLNGNAPAGGITVTLSSSSADAQVPPTVTVLAGNNSAAFNISTSNIVASEKVNISATYNSFTVSSGLGIGSSIAIRTIASSPSSITAGTTSTGTVTLSNPAPIGGVVVSLASSNAVAQVPPSVTVLPGHTSATFNITTFGTNSTVSLSVSGTLNGKTVSSGLVVGASVSVHYVTIPTSSVTGGASSTGTVYLNGTAPTEGTLVTLNSTNAAAQVPTTVTVLAGQSSANFNIATTAVTSNKSLSITASLNSHSASYGFQVCVPNLISLTTTGSTTITSGTTATIKVTLNGPAPIGGILVQLSSSSTDASVPASILIPEGQTSATFTVTTKSVTSAKNITITGTHTQSAHINFKITP